MPGSRSTVRRIALATVAGLAVVVGVSVPALSANAAGTAGYCPDGTGVTVVVDFQELGGETLIRCAPGEQENGLTALENAGFEVAGTDRWGKSFICRINGKPGTDTEPCTNTPPADAYWSYWHADNGGTWEYSSTGATYSKPAQGSFEGWSFSKNRTPDDNPYPRVAPARPVVQPTPSATVSAGPSTPATSYTASGRAAGTWLAGELVDGGLPGFVGTDWGLTLDALFALQATGADPAASRAVTSATAAHVTSYSTWDDWGVAGVRIAGATAKLLVAAVSTGSDPRAYGGHDLRTETLELVATDGVHRGRVRDRYPAESGGVDASNTFAQSFAVIGLARSGGVPQDVVDFLIRQQCAAGGFRLSPDTFGTPSATCDESTNAVLDPDSTSMAVQALLTAAEAGAAGAAGAAAKGADWLVKVQRADGSFGGSGPTEASNTNSTGLAGQALAAAGRREAADRAAAYVVAHQLTIANAGKATGETGAIAYNTEGLTTAQSSGVADNQRDQWRRATAQALLALAQVPFGKLGGDGSGPGPSGSPTASPTATGTPSPTASVTPSGSVTDPGPSPTAPGVTESPTNGGGGLPTTGASVVLMVVVAVVLVGGGAGLVVATRRRGARS